MKQKTIIHKGYTYLFTLYEEARICVIDKGPARDEYTIRKRGSNWKCDCWGDQRWNHCWHRLKGLPETKRMPSLTEPWVEWAEEAMVMNEENKNEQRDR